VRYWRRKMSALYADVIIDISHEAIDRAFQYRIPEELANDIKIGCQVNIPFGKGNHLRCGYVIGITDTSAYDEDKIKCIDSVVTEGVQATGRLLELAGWIKENYGSTMINAISTVMPVKKTVKSQVTKSVVLTAHNLDELEYRYEKKNAKAKLRLLRALRQRERLPMSYVTGELMISSSTLKSMEEEDAILIVSDSSYRSVTDNSVSYAGEKTQDIILNDTQQAIVDEFSQDFERGDLNTYLLHGVTGSGKTEVYVRCIQKVISTGKQAIMLIPEIALTYQTVNYFKRYFGDRVTIINSRLSSGEKFDQFERARNGDVDVIIGPRSALFSPFENLGLIIIDEEHEGSYKSDNPPKYHARDVALKRAEIDGASVILGSATPSVESYKRALSGEFKLWTMAERAKSRPMAETVIVDLRQELKNGNRSIISNELAYSILDRLEKKEQVMLFINKRGYNSFVSCRNCGEAVKCPHCDVSMTKHTGKYVNDKGKLICHYCGYSIPEPVKCPSCGSKLIGGYGVGTEKVEQEIKELFPNAKVLRMDRDTTKTKNSHQRILEEFSEGKADILVGTQMIVKGHDFANVTLVGILLADLTLFNNDYRAGERTFDLLTQAAGRAGRGDIPGKVIIQTYKPDNYAITAASEQDYAAFYDMEEAYRSVMRYPPEWNMMVVLAVCSDEERLANILDKMYSLVREKFAAERRLSLVGPAAPTISKIKDMYRRVLYIKHQDYKLLTSIKDVLEDFISSQEIEDVSVQFDFNPMNMY
jgi:primosomal protein N' (replication factor Y)